jgi:3-dehydroquinate dehydratase/shikimate dehydrogenase
MHPNVDESPMDAKYLRRGMIVMDTVSNPEQTLLVKEAREQNCRVVTGLDVFARQAAMQFSQFTNPQETDPAELEPGPVDLMRAAVKRAIGPANWES